MKMNITVHSFSSHFKIIILFLLFGSSFCGSALANGAASFTGIHGREVTVPNMINAKDLAVSEEVTLGGRGRGVSVRYIIKNNAKSNVSFDMLFPFYSCELYKYYYGDNLRFSKELNFSSKLNGKELESLEVDSQDINFQEGYANGEEKICSYVKFKVDFLPGENTLDINYDLHLSHTDTDGYESFYYSYYIWPAKNWVKEFTTVKYSIYLPKVSLVSKIDTGNNKFVNWYYDEDLADWYMSRLELVSPVDMTILDDHFEFFAENLKPQGVLSFSIISESLPRMVKTCSNKNLNKCWEGALKKVMTIKPYLGNKKLYTDNDLKLIPTENEFGYPESIYSPLALKYIRNEIYARNGYKFKSKTMQNYFESMPWYKPLNETVKLNKIEEKNIEYLLDKEKAAVGNSNEK